MRPDWGSGGGQLQEADAAGCSIPRRGLEGMMSRRGLVQHQPDPPYVSGLGQPSPAGMLGRDLVACAQPGVILPGRRAELRSISRARLPSVMMLLG